MKKNLFQPTLLISGFLCCCPALFAHGFQISVTDKIVIWAVFMLVLVFLSFLLAYIFSFFIKNANIKRGWLFCASGQILFWNAALFGNIFETLDVNAVILCLIGLAFLLTFLGIRPTSQPE